MARRVPGPAGTRSDAGPPAPVELDVAPGDPGPSRVPGPVLVIGFDRRPESIAALMTAASLGRALGAFLQVVHAVDLADYPVDPDQADWESGAGQALAEERRAAAEVLGHYPHGWSYRAWRDDPARALARAAEAAEATMVVTGVRADHKHWTWERWGHEPLALRVARHTSRPVLVVTHVPGPAQITRRRG
jgi:nucleotide-binding universal stress UspA family protein